MAHLSSAQTDVLRRPVDAVQHLYRQAGCPTDPSASWDVKAYFEAELARLGGIEQVGRQLQASCCVGVPISRPALGKLSNGPFMQTDACACCGLLFYFARCQC